MMSSVNPRERAAHIACAVVLTIVVLSVVVALIVYFTAGNDMPPKCDGPSGEEVHQGMKLTDTARRTEVKRRAPAPTPKKTTTTPKRTQKIAPVKLSSDSSGAAFRTDSGMAAAVAANGGNTLKVAQGVTVNPRQAGYSENLANFTENYQDALSQVNPMINQLSDTPVSIHDSYMGDFNNPHLQHQYSDSVLFSKFLAPNGAWRKEQPVRFNRSADYNSAIIQGNQFVNPAPRV